MRRRKTSSARRAPSARSCSSPRSCTTETLALLHLLAHRLGDLVVRVAPAEFRELLVGLLMPALLAQVGDTLQPLFWWAAGQLGKRRRLAPHLIGARRRSGLDGCLRSGRRRCCGLRRGSRLGLRAATNRTRTAIAQG